MITQEFYLDNERMTIGKFYHRQVSLPVYQEKNNHREEFNLDFAKADNLVPILWLSEVRYSILHDKQQLIILQVEYEAKELQNLDKKGRITRNLFKVADKLPNNI